MAWNGRIRVSLTHMNGDVLLAGPRLGYQLAGMPGPGRAVYVTTTAAAIRTPDGTMT
jgi:hypothetical protein